ncbi:YhcG family protein [Raineyella sp. LH-20]|uniref:PDDEXK nuclease domain-containing protein n=1 Tax=Raineyella sp. LH-20 TaxID=3081204 RepID=UPI002953D80E|nr:PDDEXK nuclease domain-containing protein [Raineyella sp. LH-20]WOP17470.1 PDDEXK nuclease domain-containing protein [Raineyella sp. LH-20]
MRESTPSNPERDSSPSCRPPTGAPATGEDLVEQLSSLIDQAREAIASYANATLTMTYWRVGAIIDSEVLNEERAEYGAQTLVTLSQELTARFGRGFDEPNLNRMVKFARLFPDTEILVTLSQKLSWSHFLALLPLRSADARGFYAREAAAGRWTVRELRRAIQRKAYERREIADSQIGPGSMVPVDTFSDPYLLDFLGLHDGFAEADLEAAILRDLEAFLLEVGTGFTFVERQKRMVIDDKDFHLDLLLYHRSLKRLVAVELKIGEFDARHEGQMKLYLKWLDRYERKEGEEAPIGLILCTEASREQIELLEMHKDGIVVAEYWTALPPKHELEARLQAMLRSARERLVRRQLPSQLGVD